MKILQLFQELFEAIRENWNRDRFYSKAVGYDKLTHAGASCMGAELLQGVGVHWIPAAITVFVIGVVVEIYQEITGETFLSLKDITANTTGILVSIIF